MLITILNIYPLIQKSKAVVLKTVNFKESSLIVTLFTRLHGKIAVIAKGARRPKNKFAAFLVPGQVLEVVYYMKSSRSVQTLSEVSYSLKLDQLRYDVEKMAIATITMELVSHLVHENEVNKPVFDFLLTFLPWVNAREEVSKIIFPYVQIRLAQLIGIGLQSDVKDRKSMEKGYLNIQTGELSDKPAGTESVPLTNLQFAFLFESLHSSKSAIFEINFKKNELNDLIEYLDRYFRYHIEDFRPRKSDKIFDQLLNN